MSGIPISRAKVLALAAAGALVARPRSSRAQAAPIRLACYTTDAYAQPFYASELGYFTRAGLNVEVTILANAAANAQMVAANAIDICLADPIQIAHPVNAGVPLTFFAGGSLYASAHPTTVLVAATDSTVRTAKDFEGQTLAVIGLASISSLAVREWLRQNGANVELVKLVELPFASMAAALQRGTVAGAFLAEPFLSGATGSVRVLARAYDSIAKSFSIASFFATRDWILKNRDTARKLTGVIYDTARWANTHQTDSAAILSKYSKIDVDRVRSMTRVTYATSIDARQLQPVLDVALEYKQLEHRVDANDIILRP
jgi:NitT/TauT family transport system substrate-binding protein